MRVQGTQRARSPWPGWLWRRLSGSRIYTNPAWRTQVSGTTETMLTNGATPGPSKAWGSARQGRLQARPCAPGRWAPGCPAARAGPWGLPVLPGRGAPASRSLQLQQRGRLSGRHTPSRLSPWRFHGFELWLPRHFCSRISNFLIFKTIP